MIAVEIVTNSHEHIEANSIVEPSPVRFSILKSLDFPKLKPFSSDDMNVGSFNGICFYSVEIVPEKLKLLAGA